MAEMTPRQAGGGVTGVILAGGLSSRFGSNKALALWRGKPLIAHMLDLLKPWFPERLVVAKNPEEYRPLGLDAKLVEDGSPRRHPLVGVLSGLSASSAETAFVCGCDMPLLQEPLVKTICGAAEGRDAAAPTWAGKIQPLCAAYSKRCLPAVRAFLEEEHGKCHGCADLFSRVNARILAEPETARADPGGLSFLDVDTLSDYAAVLEKSRAAPH